MASSRNKNKNLMNNISGTSNMIKGSLSGLDEVNSEVGENTTEASIQEKSENEKKEKRSFMLTNEQIEMIYKLKIKFKNKTYGVIVGDAIEDFFKKHYQE